MAGVLPRRWVQKIAVSDGGCWLWTGYRDGCGYGRLSARGRCGVVAHRVIYESMVGPIPDGMELDHLCRTRDCVNPAHLEPVTHTENILRGRSLSALNARKTECKRGHPLSGENLVFQSKGARDCRACRRVRAARAHNKRRGYAG